MIGQVNWAPERDAPFLGIDTAGTDIGMISYGNDDLWNGEVYNASGATITSDNWIWASASPVPALAAIDIKPGSDSNSVNPKSKGVIPVAALGSTDFDATQVDFPTVTFGPDGASTAHDGHVEDVNDDGFMDMVFHFKTQETGIVCGDTEATLMGETFEGIQITGSDMVKTIKCN